MRILCGQVQNVILSLRLMAKRRELSKQRVEELERVCGYFKSNAHRMAYDMYLAAGYPISSGVIEGARRCVVNDGMERSGIRRVLAGAHASDVAKEKWWSDPIIDTRIEGDAAWLKADGHESLASQCPSRNRVLSTLACSELRFASSVC